MERAKIRVTAVIELHEPLYVYDTDAAGIAALLKEEASKDVQEFYANWLHGQPVSEVLSVEEA